MGDRDKNFIKCFSHPTITFYFDPFYLFQNEPFSGPVYCRRSQPSNFYRRTIISISLTWLFFPLFSQFSIMSSFSFKLFDVTTLDSFILFIFSIKAFPFPISNEEDAILYCFDILLIIVSSVYCVSCTVSVSSTSLFTLKFKLKLTKSVKTESILYRTSLSVT